MLKKGQGGADEMDHGTQWVSLKTLGGPGMKSQRNEFINQLKAVPQPERSLNYRLATRGRQMQKLRKSDGGSNFKYDNGILGFDTQALKKSRDEVIIVVSEGKKRFVTQFLL